MNKKNISVLFLTKYMRNGASSRYRSFQYFPYLEKRGIHCHVSSLFDDDYLIKYNQSKKITFSNIITALLRRFKILLSAKNFDLVIIEKEILPYFPSIFEKYLSYQGIPYIVDYDDALFHKYDSHPNILIRLLLGQKIAKVMSKASLVIAGNNYLADYAVQAGAKQIEIIPTVIDLEDYPKREKKANSNFTIGWIGSPSTALYLHAIAPALEKICEDKNVHICLIGSGKVELPNIALEIIAWDELTEVQNLQKFDVGIMPLMEGIKYGKWEKGKCGLKLIQYMGCNLPVVASPIGVNTTLIENGNNGFLVSTIDEWINALTILKENPNLRTTMGEKGRKMVEQNYSLQSTETKYTRCLLQLLR